MNPEAMAVKLGRVAEAMEAEGRPVDLLALFMRDDPSDPWDLAVSAPDLKPGDVASYEYVVGHVKAVLSPAEMSFLSKVVILSPTGAVARSLLSQFNGVAGPVGLYYVLSAGSVIRKALVVKARPPRPVVWASPKRSPHPLA